MGKVTVQYLGLNVLAVHTVLQYCTYVHEVSSLPESLISTASSGVSLQSMDFKLLEFQASALIEEADDASSSKSKNSEASRVAVHHLFYII